MKPSRRELLKLLGTSVAGVGLGYLLSQVPKVYSTPEYYVIRKESYVSPADVIVFREGDYAVAIDGKTKEIIAKSIDHGKVIQKAINTLFDESIVWYDAEGNEHRGMYVGCIYIYISRGYYKISEKKNIIIPENSRIHIRGAGMHQTVLQFDTSWGVYETYGAVVLQAYRLMQSDPTWSSGNYKSDLSHFLEISDLTLKINDPNLNGINVKYLHRFVLRNVHIKGYYTTTPPPSSPITQGLYLQNMQNDEVCILDNVMVSGFTIGVRIEAGHLIGLGVEAAYCRTNFRFDGGRGIVLIRPHSYIAQDYDYYFVDGEGILIEPDAEGGKGTAFYVEAGKTPNFRIYNVYSTSNSLLGGDIQRLKFYGIGFENSGIAVLSGDGTTTNFLIGEHGLSPSIDDPSKVIVKVTPASPDAINASPCVGYLSDEDNDGIYESIRVKFASAPPSGTDNVKVVWEVEYIG